jgi:hypothetical protein
VDTGIDLKVEESKAEGDIARVWVPQEYKEMR